MSAPEQNAANENEKQDRPEENLPEEPPESGEAARTEPVAESQEETELERSRREAKENYDRMLRIYADFENFKKRMDRERADLIRYANEGVIRDLLPVVDNLERALEQARKSGEAESVVQGVELILKQLTDLLEKHGVKAVQALGEPFDPNLHEAVMHEVSEEHEDNRVIDQFQTGYLFRDRLLRPAMVKVSKKAGNKADVEMPQE